MSGWDAGFWVGLTLGLRHALDADHLVAVSGMLSQSRSLGRALAIGAWWGAGHGMTTLVVGGAVLASGWSLPPALQGLAEVAVGVVLVALGTHVLWRHRRARLVWRPHRHGSLVHAHLHRRAGPGEPDAQARDHSHPRPDREELRSFGVGTVHGLAGTGPLAILLALGFGDLPARLVALSACAAGSLVSMVAVTGALAVPFLLTASPVAPWHRRLRLSVGLGSAAYGLLLAATSLVAI